MHRRTAIAALMALAAGLSACQGPSVTPALELQRNFAQVEIKRIGDYHPSYAEYQDLAVLNALGELVAAGTAPDRIKRVVIEPVQVPGLPQQRFGFAQYPDYHLWLTLTGCDSNIFARSSFSGRLISLTDRAGCLSA